MTVLAAPGDTWGIPGPIFLALYLAGRGRGCSSAPLVHRFRVLAGTATGDAGPTRPAAGRVPQRRRPARGLDARSAACAAAAWSACAPTGGSPPAARCPPGVTPLDQAIYNAAAPARPRSRELPPGRVGRPRARPAARRPAAARPGARPGPARPPPGVGPTAARRPAADRRPPALRGSRPTAGRSATWCSPWCRCSSRSCCSPGCRGAPAPADRALQRAAPTAHLAAALRRTRPTPPTAPADAAMGVALFGTATLWALDPGFAEQAEIQRAGDQQHAVARRAAAAAAARAAAAAPCGAAAAPAAAVAAAAAAGAADDRRR